MPASSAARSPGGVPGGASRNARCASASASPALLSAACARPASASARRLSRRAPSRASVMPDVRPAAWRVSAAVIRAVLRASAAVSTPCPRRFDVDLGLRHLARRDAAGRCLLDRQAGLDVQVARRRGGRVRGPQAVELHRGRSERFPALALVEGGDRRAGCAVVAPVHRPRLEPAPDERALELEHVRTAAARAEVPVRGLRAAEHEHRPGGDGHQHRALADPRSATRQAGHDLGVAGGLLQLRRGQHHGLRRAVADGAAHDHLARELAALDRDRDGGRLGRSGLGRDLRGRADLPPGHPRPRRQQHGGGQSDRHRAPAAKDAHFMAR